MQGFRFKPSTTEIKKKKRTGGREGRREGERGREGWRENMRKEEGKEKERTEYINENRITFFFTIPKKRNPKKHTEVKVF